MREEITKAKELSLRLWKEIEAGSREPYDLEQQTRLDKVWEHWDRISECVKQFKMPLDTYPGSTISFSVVWDSEKPEHNNIVIEISKYGPLAAVFSYGEIPEGLVEWVNQCIDAQGLLRLTKEELDTLENDGSYLWIF